MKLRNHNDRVEAQYHVPCENVHGESWAKAVAQALMTAMCGKSQVLPRHVADAYCGHLRNGTVSQIGSPEIAIGRVCDLLRFDNESDDAFVSEAITFAREILRETDMEVPEWIYRFAMETT